MHKTIKFKYLGGASTVTGSCLLIDGIAFDLGMHQGKDIENAYLMTYKDELANIRYAAITHNHFDHTGDIPHVTEDGCITIIGTKATMETMYASLIDSAEIFVNDLKMNGEKAEGFFNKKDVKSSMKCWQAYDYHEPIVLENGKQITFGNAGHILGSSYVEYKRKCANKWIDIFVSGDIGNESKKMLRRDQIISGINNGRMYDIMFLESTYDKNHDKSLSVKEQLMRSHIQTIDKGGQKLYAAFANGRAQNILMEYFELYQQLPKEYRVPIYFDSKLGMEMINAYINNYDLLTEKGKRFVDAIQGKNNLSFPELTFVDSGEKYISIKETIEPIIVIAGGGMGLGPIQKYLYMLCKVENTFDQIGYMAEGTNGYEIINAVRGQKIKLKGCKEFTLNAEIIKTENMSDHADLRQKLRIVVNSLKPNGTVVLGHGTYETELAFGQEILEARPDANIIRPDDGVEYEIKFEEEIQIDLIRNPLFAKTTLSRCVWDRYEELFNKGLINDQNDLDRIQNKLYELEWKKQFGKPMTRIEKEEFLYNNTYGRNMIEFNDTNLNDSIEQ